MVQEARGCASGAPACVWRWLCALFILLLSPGLPAWADGGVTFTDVAENGGAGITYLRAGTPERQAARAAIEAMETLPNETWRMTRALQFPMKADGTPGVALLDFDDDGDLDIYVTNGPGAPNSLFSNQLEETGVLEFVDVAADAGVTATDQDSSGVCFGDIDNDGDLDLYVLGVGEQHRLFENQLVRRRGNSQRGHSHDDRGRGRGRAVFEDITARAGAGGPNRGSVGCSMADFDGDGLLDIVIANKRGVFLFVQGREAIIERAPVIPDDN